MLERPPHTSAYTPHFETPQPLYARRRRSAQQSRGRTAHCAGAEQGSRVGRATTVEGRPNNSPRVAGEEAHQGHRLRRLPAGSVRTTRAFWAPSRCVSRPREARCAAWSGLSPVPRPRSGSGESLVVASGAARFDVWCGSFYALETDALLIELTRYGCGPQGWSEFQRDPHRLRRVPLIRL